MTAKPQPAPNYESYHLAEFGDFAAGDTIRFGGGGPFADGLILGFNERGEARIARPYVFVSGVGTTGPTPLTGVEIVNCVSQTTLAAMVRVDRGSYRCLSP